MHMLNKTVKLFGKTLPVALLALIAMAGTATALLSVYVTTSGSANVSQSVVLTDCQLYENSNDVCTGETSDSANFSVNVVGGDSRDVGLKIKNNAVISADFNLGSTAVTDATIAFYDGYDTETQQCSGSPISNPITIGSGVEQFYCVRYDWNIASSPASDEPITVTVSPN